MFEVNHDNKNYSAEDIRRYLSGLMPEAEMHGLEKAALDDPFLADAIDGYEETNATEGIVMADEFDDLRARLNERITSKEKNNVAGFFRMHWWKVAAIVVVLAGSGSLFYYRTDNEPVSFGNAKQKELAYEKTVQDHESVLRAKPAAKDSVGAAPGAGEAESADSPLKSSKLKPRKDNPVYSSANDNLARVQSARPPVMLNEPLASAPAPVLSAPAGDIKADTLLALSRQESKSKEVVINEARTPATTGVVNNVRVEETSAKKSAIIVQEAAPVIGFEKYNRYLETSKKISVPDNGHGEVVITFVVNEDSTLTDYKIEKSLSKQADNEALRLIKEGPGWKVLTNKRAVVMVRIKF